MHRIHLFEIHDQLWCPAWIRDTLTNFLHLSHKLAKINRYLIPELKELLKISKRDHIVDLGSGGGGPFIDIAKSLSESSHVSVTLTDISPNFDAIQRVKELNLKSVTYYPSSVDATSVPKKLGGLRTMVASFHHMKSDQATGILKDAVAAKEPIFIFEPLARNLKGAAALLPVFITPFLLMPFLRPISLKILFFTYVIPLLPVIIIFDGWVSFLRTYMEKDLEALIAKLPADPNYKWEIKHVSPIDAPLLIGYPKHSS